MSVSDSDLTQSLNNLDIDFSASFSHGVLFALNCFLPSNEKIVNNFIELIVNDSSEHHDNQSILRDILEETIETIRKALQQDPFTFQPLIDKSSISLETESVKDWASGLILGIEQNKSKINDKKFSINSQEFLKDLGSIALMPVLDEIDGASEADLMEIEEYLRMGAIGLYFDSQTN